MIGKTPAGDFDEWRKSWIRHGKSGRVLERDAKEALCGLLGGTMACTRVPSIVWAEAAWIYTHQEFSG